MSTTLIEQVLPSESLHRLCHEFHVRELLLFGSALRPDFPEESDLDLLVEFEPDAKVGFLTLSRLQRELSSLAGRRVDLVPKRGLKPAIRAEVLGQARLLYQPVPVVDGPRCTAG